MTPRWPNLSKPGRPSVPDDVLERAGIGRAEKVLAFGQARDGSWLLGTRRSLVLLTPDERVTMPWEEVEDASWDLEGERLRVTGVGEYGRPRPSYAIEIDEPALLLQLVRERVTASIVLQRRVPVRGRLGVSVIGRRSPAGGAVRWMHAYDEGLDPMDPEVVVVADLALLQAQSEVGEAPTNSI